MGISILKDGMYLPGVPSIDDVEKVSVSYPVLTDKIKETTDKKLIELAVKLTGFLKYSPFDSVDVSQKPMLTITYFLRNGKSVSVGASLETVWWKNKAYAIKDKAAFIKLAEGIFFFGEAYTESTQ